MCCRLVAQPNCMTQDMMAGFLNEQGSIVRGDSDRGRCLQPSGTLVAWRRRFCVLRGGKLLCYSAPEEREADAEPALSVSINRETRIRPVDKEAGKKTNNFSVINPGAGEATARVFAAESREDLWRWMEAFWQHFFDFSQWKHCCEEFMTMERMSPRKPPLFSSKEATSVYQELSIDSPGKADPFIATAQRETEESWGTSLVGLDEVEVLGSSSQRPSGDSPGGGRDAEGTSRGREPLSGP